jgi:rare lipoprotein A
MTGENRAEPAAAADAPISGVASTYNPFRPGWREGGRSTASGELYDPATWTAAIKTNLRTKFGGVRYGKDYRPAYALVESADRQVIVKINDVGPLTPGRVIDLNERTMRYFDPTLERGIIRGVRVTPLPGAYWTPGPVAVTAGGAMRFAENERVERK